VYAVPATFALVTFAMIQINAKCCVSALKQKETAIHATSCDVMATAGQNNNIRGLLAKGLYIERTICHSTRYF